MNPSTALATVLIDEWVRCGVTEAVVCPGSRSAPLAYAAFEAGKAGRLRLHVRVDERSAGFLAVGLAKVSRRPAVVITTSGTAVAHLHPAVLEASHACVPMIVMSADRPAELRGTGANQTTVQPGVFAGAVRFSRDQPPAQGNPGEQASWRSTVCRAYAAAVGRAGDAGPVHLNVSLRDPLAPQETGAGQWPELLEGRGEGMPWVDWGTRSTTSVGANGHGGVRQLPAGGRVESAAQPGESPTGEPSRAKVSRRHTKTLLVLGDLPDPAMSAQALALAHRQHWPVIAEPFGLRPAASSGAVLPHGPLLLADTPFVTEYLPERVLIVGRHTLHRDIGALTRRTNVTIEQVSAVEAWSDPSHVVSRVFTWQEFLDFAPEEVDSSWAQAWTDAARRLAQRVSASTVLRSDLAGVSVAATVLDALDEDDALLLGSSNTPRDLNLADPEEAPRAMVVGNRGLSGIDGTVASAVGVALAHPGAGRVVALMGDLTFEHDVNGLLIGPDEPRPDVTLVVTNDSGGGIFATLEYGKPAHAAQLRRLFTTPTGVDIESLCRGHGVGHQRVDTLDGLRRALSASPRGIDVIEVVVDPRVDQHTRSSLRAIAASRAESPDL